MAYYDRNCWLTFRNVAVPAPTDDDLIRINKAVIVFTADVDTNGINDTANTNTVLNAVIAGHCSADSTNPTFSNRPNDYPYTATTVDWDGVSAWYDNTEYTSPNIACIIQEIINIDGWTSGNDMTLFVFNKAGGGNEGEQYKWRDVYDYGTDSSKAAQLKIWYSTEFVPDVSGGLEVGGSPAIKQTHRETMSGGLEIGGKAGAGLIAMSGGLEAGGSPAITQSHREAMTGGLELGGDVTPRVSVIMRGGLALAGNASAVFDFADIMTGGLEISSARFPNGFRYRVTITVPQGAVSADMDKFYLAVKAELESLSSSTVLVTDTDDVVHHHEVRDFDLVNGVIWLVFKADLKTASDNTFFLYYGEP